MTFCWRCHCAHMGRVSARSCVQNVLDFVNLLVLMMWMNYGIKISMALFGVLVSNKTECFWHSWIIFLLHVGCFFGRMPQVLHQTSRLEVKPKSLVERQKKKVCSYLIIRCLKMCSSSKGWGKSHDRQMNSLEIGFEKIFINYFKKINNTLDFFV